MKYIYQDEYGVTQFAKYFEYLDGIKSKLPASLYKFAADPSRYTLTDRESMHDSWLTFVSIREEDDDLNNGSRSIQIELRLLGPYHDRYFDFSYHGVNNYVFNLPERSNAPPYSGHGDLLYQEFRFTDDNQLCHEILFSSGRRIYIECAQISVQETLLKAAQ